MSKTFIKNDLIFFCSECKFPQDLIFPEALFYKDLLFSNKIQQPEINYQTKKNKFSNSFLIEEEIEGKKGGFRKGKFPANNNITRGNNFNQQVNFKRSEFEDPGFFDNFKGKSDEKKVQSFKKNMELFEVRENSLSITQNLIIDFMKSESFTLSKIDLDRDFTKKEIISTISENELFSSDSIYNMNMTNKISEGKIYNLKFLKIKEITLKK
jgi:hypothetical protein